MSDTKTKQRRLQQRAGVRGLAVLLAMQASRLVRSVVQKLENSDGPALNALVPVHRSALALLLIGMVAFSGLISPLAPADAAASDELNFQARLLNDAGGVVPDGDYHAEFKLYDSAAAGASAQGACVGGATDDCLWVETHTTGNLIRVVNGYLTVQLGSITNFPSTIDWGEELWLAINIGGDAGAASWDGEMSPRMKVSAVPFAFDSDNLDGLDSTDFVQLGQGTQTDASTNSSIFINKTGATGDILTLQDGGTTELLFNQDGELTIGSASQDGSLILGDGTTHFGTLQTAALGGNRTYTLPDATGTILLDTTLATTAFVQGGNSFGATAVLGTNDAQSLQLEVGGVTAVTIADGGAVTFQNETDSVTGFRVMDADGGTPILNVDTTNERVGIGTAAPAYTLDVQRVGAANIPLARFTATGGAGADAFITFREDTEANNWSIGLRDDSTNRFEIAEAIGFGSNNYFSILSGTGNVGIGQIAPDARLEIAGNLTQAAWGLNGAQLQAASATYTDSSTAASGTATNAVFNSFGTPTLAATNTSVTTTNAATVYIQGAPTAGTNQTITNGYALWVDAGNVRIDDNLLVNGNANRFQTTTDSTTALQVLDADGGTSIFNIDTVNERIGIGTDTPATKLQVVGPVTFGNASQAGLLHINDGTSNFGTLQTAALGSNRTYDLPDADGTICLQSSSSCGFATGSGAAFIQGGNSFGATAILGTNDGQSLQFEVGGVDALTIADGGAITVQNETDSVTGFQVMDADGGNPVLNVDTTNERVGIGTASPQAPLHILGTNPSVRIENNSTTQYSSSAFVLRNAETSDAETEWHFFAQKDAAGAGTGQSSFQIRKRNAAHTEAITPFLIDSNNNIVMQSGYSIGSALSYGNVGIGVSTPGGRLVVGGNMTASAWGASGILLRANGITATDSSTAASGTATNAVFNSFGTPTLAATNATVTTTNAATVYVQGAPTAGTNQTITNPYALWIDDGVSRFDGVIRAAAGTASSPSINFTGDQNTGIYSISDNILGFSTNGAEKLRLDATGNATLVGALTVQGASATIGTTTQAGSLILHEDTNNNTVTINTGTQATGSFAVSFPDLNGNDTFCLVSEANCSGGSGEWTDATTFLRPTDSSGAQDIVIGATSTANADIWLQATGAAVFNEQGADADFRIEGVGQANALFVQGSDGFVGIGTGAPGSNLEVSATSADVNFALTSSGGSGKSFVFRSSTTGTLTIRDNTAGANRLTINTDGDVTINPQGVDSDFTVQSDTIADAFEVSGTTGAIRLGVLDCSVGFANGGAITADASGTLSCTDDDGGGATTTLQQAYDNDADGSDTVIALTTADDSLIVRNPATSGTDSGYVALFDQLNTGAVDGVRVSNSGTGVGQSITLANTTGTQTAGLSINRSGAGGTTTSLLALTQSGGTATNGILFTGTIGTDITTATNRALTIDTAGTGTITIGGGTGIKTIDLATGGTGAKTVTLGSTASTSSLTLNSGTGNINVGTTAQARSINVGTAAAVQTVTVGSTNTTSSTTIQSGSGGISLTGAATASSTLAVQGATLTVGTTTQAGSLILHEDTNNNTVTINTGTQATGSFAVSFPTLGAADTFCLATAANCAGGATTTLQQAYNNSSAPATVDTADNKNVVFNLADTSTDSSFIVNIQGTGNVFQVQDGGTPALTVVDGGAVTAAGTLAVQGASVTVGGASQAGSIVLYDNDAGSETVTLTTGSVGSSLTFTLPTAYGSSGYCLKDTDASGTLGFADCGAGATVTLQQAYTNGNSITTTDNRNILFTLDDTSTDSDFIVNLVGTGNTFEVQDGGTPVFTIADGGALTATGNAVFKPGTDSASAFVVQEAGGQAYLTVDTESATDVLQVRIGAGTDDVVFVLDAFTTDPTGTVPNGAMFYDSDGHVFRCRINGAWANCDTSGGSGDTMQVTLIPEFGGGTLVADGSSNTGIMSAGVASGLSPGEGYMHNYYDWRSNQGSVNDYDVVINYQLPSDFNATNEFNTSSWKVWTYSNTLADTTITITIQDEEGTVCVNAENIEYGTVSTWGQITLTNNPNTTTDCDFGPNEMMRVTIKMGASNGSRVRLGEIEFSYDT